MSRAYCCRICSGANPHWYLMRRGDVEISWACDDHLVNVLNVMQRPNEVTHIAVSDYRKSKARAEAQAALDRLERAVDELPRP